MPYFPTRTLDPDLEALAALATTGLVDRTGAGAATTRTTGTTGLNVLAAADEAAARTAIGAQPYDPDLAALAALATTGLVDRTGAGTATTRTTGTTGLNVLAAANEAAARTAIGAMANTAPEIITNANGTAYRWPNGLQICRFQSGSSTSTPTAWGSLYVSSSIQYTFPAAFNAIPIVAPAFRFVFGEGPTTIAWGVPSVTSTTSTAMAVAAVNVNGGSRPGYIAIGTYTP